MKKRILSLLLSAVLLTAPTLAASYSTENFLRVKAYESQFSDLTADHTFYPNIAALYEYGLSVGKADGTYGLTDSLTVGQAVIFAGRIRSLYATGDAEAGAWTYRAAAAALPEPYRTYMPYLLFLQDEGVLDIALDAVLEQPATRAQMAHVLASVLPETELPPINDALVTQGYATRCFISDVTEYTPYFQDILTLYRTGVCNGTDAVGSFLPEQTITRGAVAAMLTRLVDPTLRITLDWSLADAYSAAGTTMASLVEPGTYFAAPATEAEMTHSIRHMLSQGKNTLTLQYPSCSESDAQWVMELALSAVKAFCEQGYNKVSCQYSISGNVLLTFTATGADNAVETYRSAALESAIAVHDALWESGQLTVDMTQTEKARVYYEWICKNCVYDEGAGNASLSHIPYSLFRHGYAVCDGYTGAYNLLLKLEGIPCSAVSNDNHIWTTAVLDGVAVHIDVTWADRGDWADNTYFAMTPAYSEELHRQNSAA